MSFDRNGYTLGLCGRLKMSAIITRGMNMNMIPRFQDWAVIIVFSLKNQIALTAVIIRSIPLKVQRNDLSGRLPTVYIPAEISDGASSLSLTISRSTVTMKALAI